MVALNFNASQVQPNVRPEPIPTGQYPVVIVRTEEKPTKAGTGSYIEIEMQVQAGEFAGRKVYDRLNIRNPNQQAVDIAYSTLSAICHVTGRIHIQDTAQLHGVPFIAVVKKIPRNDQPTEMTNEIAGYKDINGNDPGFAGTVAQPQAQPQWAQQIQQPPAPAPAPAAPVQPAASAPTTPNGAAPPPWAQAQQTQQTPAPAAPPPWVQPQN